METGTIVEFIERQKIVCAAVLEIRKLRARLLTESNRELKVSAARLSLKGSDRLDTAMGREKLAGALKETAERRKALSEEVDVAELWEILHTEQEWIDLDTMTGLCFSNGVTDDHASAVMRAFFKNRLYFKFDHNRFFPYTPEQVEALKAQAAEEERTARIIQACGDWLKRVAAREHPAEQDALPVDERLECLDMLKSYYLFDGESPYCDIAKAIAARAGVGAEDALFNLLVRLRAWDKNENIDLLRLDVPVAFSEEVMRHAEALNNPPAPLPTNRRRDLTSVPLMTIDGQSTLDFDDALSIQTDGNNYLLGVHIADVAHYIKKDDPADREALARASSIYMPDQKISMLPPCLSEDLCSLKAGETRPAVSILARMTPQGDLLDHEIVPSLIRVKDQLTYHDINALAHENEVVAVLYDLARAFRRRRFDQGAVHIAIPEINVWIEESGQIQVSKIVTENPARILVSEIMILANWIMAGFLAENGAPAVFRSQPKPKDRLYRENGGTLFQNWMQRKLLNRFILGHKPEPHNGLGLDAYVTATSPIRKYSDLVTQRQVRAVLGLEDPYTEEEITQIIHAMEQAMGNVSKLQFRRKRHWLLKYLEGKVGGKEPAIVLTKKKNAYAVLLTEYMIECDIPRPGGVTLKPADMIQVTVQHVNARKDVLSVFLG